MSNNVDQYLNQQVSPQKEICERLRDLMLRTFPGAKEEMKWGVPAFADGKFYIVALKDHVNLGFSLKGMTKEDEKLFDGGGKIMKHIQVSSLDGIDEKRIIRLLKLVDRRHS